MDGMVGMVSGHGEVGDWVGVGGVGGGGVGGGGVREWPSGVMDGRLPSTSQNSQKSDYNLNFD